MDEAGLSMARKEFLLLSLVITFRKPASTSLSEQFIMFNSDLTSGIWFDDPPSEAQEAIVKIGGAWAENPGSGNLSQQQESGN